MHLGQAFSVASEHAHGHDSSKPQQRHRHNIPLVHHAQVHTYQFGRLGCTWWPRAFSLTGDSESVAFLDFCKRDNYLKAPEKATWHAEGIANLYDASHDWTWNPTQHSGTHTYVSVRQPEITCVNKDITELRVLSLSRTLFLKSPRVNESYGSLLSFEALE
jgi:hypothetical protein